jgi:hypothetical protein
MIANLREIEFSYSSYAAKIWWHGNTGDAVDACESYHLGRNEQSPSPEDAVSIVRAVLDEMRMQVKYVSLNEALCTIPEWSFLRVFADKYTTANLLSIQDGTFTLNPEHSEFVYRRPVVEIPVRYHLDAHQTDSFLDRLVVFGAKSSHTRGHCGECIEASAVYSSYGDRQRAVIGFTYMDSAGRPRFQGSAKRGICAILEEYIYYTMCRERDGDLSTSHAHTDH